MLSLPEKMHDANITDGDRRRRDSPRHALQKGDSRCESSKEGSREAVTGAHSTDDS